MLLRAVGPDALEVELTSGRMSCPSCGERLSPWGYARSRVVRMTHGVRTLKPRRALCRACATTCVLLPAWSLPRRRDGAEVILEALLDGARGNGHRTIARRLNRPPGTVREWLRRGRRNAHAIRCRAVTLLHQTLGPLDHTRHPVGSPLGSPLQDAMDVLGRAVSAVIRRFGPDQHPFEYAVTLAGGLIAATTDGRKRDHPAIRGRPPLTAP